MEDMGEDEVVALMASAVAGIFGLARWYGVGLTTSWLGASRTARLLLLVLPPLAILGLWQVLGTYAAVDVREDFRYQLLFAVMGTIWVLLLPRALTLIGVSFEDDALERRNAAASIAIGGAVVSLGVLFAGSNMGEGPSIWNTVETALVATGVLGIAVLLHALATQVGDSIAVERDVATGLRFAGWIVGSGLVLARASAGDWAGEAAMVNDLVHVGWPVLALLVIAIPTDSLLKPSDRSPSPNLLVAGLLPGFVYVGAAVGYIAALPQWTE